MFWKVLTGLIVFGLIILISITTISMAKASSTVGWVGLFLFSAFLGLTIGVLPISHEMDNNA